MCGYFCIGFFNSMLKDKSVTDFTNLFSPNDFIENDDIILKIIKYKTMLSYCLKCRKNTENINPKISGTSNGKTMILSNCAICGSKKSKFIKNKKQMDYWVVLELKHH